MAGSTPVNQNCAWTQHPQPALLTSLTGFFPFNTPLTWMKPSNEKPVEQILPWLESEEVKASPEKWQKQIREMMFRRNQKSLALLPVCKPECVRSPGKAGSICFHALIVTHLQFPVFMFTVHRHWCLITVLQVLMLRFLMHVDNLTPESQQ